MINFYALSGASRRRHDQSDYDAVDQLFDPVNRREIDNVDCAHDCFQFRSNSVFIHGKEISVRHPADITIGETLSKQFRKST